MEQSLESLLEKIHAKAARCTRAARAKRLRDIAPNRSEARKIYWARWVELSSAEAPAKATACATAAEVNGLYNSAPNGSVAKKIYEARWIELHLQGKQVIVQDAQGATRCLGGVFYCSVWTSARFGLWTLHFRLARM